MKKCEKCETCPFYEPANGACFFPGDCSLPEDAEILKLIREDYEDPLKEIRS